MKESSALNDSHFQAYTVLTLCRILYREKNENVASKKVAAIWVNKVYGHRWEPLINTAQNWHYGQEHEFRTFIKMRNSCSIHF